jgi:disulfide bond formation protein DsbB
VSLWYCELVKSNYHACPACWLERFLLTVFVVVPLLHLLVH